MLDRVAAGDDGIFLAFATIDMAARLLAEAMRLVDQRLKNRKRIGDLVLNLPGRREGVRARREQFDPIGAACDLLAHRRARVFNRANHRAGQRVLRRRRVPRRRSPDDSQRRDLISGTVEAALIDRVADLDVAVSIAVGAHITRRGETGPQIRLHVLDGDQHGAFRRRLWSAVVEHVRVRVDEPGQYRRLPQVDHLHAGRNRDAPFGSDLGNSLARNKHHLVRQHLPALAVEQAAGADRDLSRSRRAFVEAAVRSHARRRPGSPPRSRRRLNLRRERHRRRTQENPEHGGTHRYVSHLVASHLDLPHGHQSQRNARDAHQRFSVEHSCGAGAVVHPAIKGRHVNNRHIPE